MKAFDWKGYLASFIAGAIITWFIMGMRIDLVRKDLDRAQSDLAQVRQDNKQCRMDVAEARKGWDDYRKAQSDLADVVAQDLEKARQAQKQSQDYIAYLVGRKPSPGTACEAAEDLLNEYSKHSTKANP